MKNKEHKKSMLENGTYKKMIGIERNLKKSKNINISGEIYQRMYKNENIYEFIKEDNIDIKDMKSSLKEKIINEFARENDLKNLDVVSYMQMKDARCKQAQKIRKHIEFMKDSGLMLIFATFTFNEDDMKKKPNTRYQMVMRALNESAAKDYIVNIDYGDNNDREHYHAIIGFEYGLFEPTFKVHTKSKGIGYFITNVPIYYAKEVNGIPNRFYSYELIGDTEEDDKRVSKYIAKLTMHAIKIKQTRIKTKKNSDYHDWLRKQ